MSDVKKRTGVRETEWILEMIAAPRDWENHRLQPGDLVLAARGEKNTAAVFTSRTAKAIPASTVLVLRPKQAVDPFFLGWYLNQPHAQARLRAMRVGSSIPFLPIAELEKLPVPVPSKEVQARVFELALLGEEEQLLMEMSSRKRAELVAGAIQMLLARSEKIPSSHSES